MLKIPAGQVPRIIEGLLRLQTTSIASQVRDGLFVYEMDEDLDLCFNCCEAVQEAPWDQLNVRNVNDMRQRNIYFVLPPRVKALLLQKPFVPDEFCTTPEDVIFLECKFCPPGCVLVWKDSNLFAAIDALGAYAPEQRVPPDRTTFISELNDINSRVWRLRARYDQQNAPE